MKLSVTILVLFSLWAIMLFGVLQLGTIDLGMEHTHSICGAWGCGPPLQALIAWHGFWLLLIAPPFLLAGRFGRSRWVRKAGLLSVILGIVLLLGVGIREATTWLPLIESGEPTFFLQRYLYSVFFLHGDYPMVPLLLSGLALLTIESRRSPGCTQRDLQTEIEAKLTDTKRKPFENQFQKGSLS